MAAARRLGRRALAEKIAEAIRQRDFRPGEWLRQIDLEERFDTSRFHVRGALEELAVRKTIEHVPNCGYRVAQIDDATSRAIRETRLILEVAAVPAIVANADGAAVAHLQALADDFGRAVYAGTHLEQSDTNRAFHRLMLALCGNPILEETVWALRDRARGSGVTVWASQEALLRSDRDHRAMVAALSARDAAALALLVAEHIVKDAALTHGLSSADDGDGCRLQARG